MTDFKSAWKGATNREHWAARGATFVAKVKATKAVWFPPQPAETGKKAASGARKTTKRASKKTTGAGPRGPVPPRRPGPPKEGRGRLGHDWSRLELTYPARFDFVSDGYDHQQDEVEPSGAAGMSGA